MAPDTGAADASQTPLYFALAQACHAQGAETDWLVETVRLLVAAGADVSRLDDNRNPPLIHAAQYCGPKVVALLAEGGAKVDVRNGSGVTPLAMALIMGNFDAAEALVSKGARIGKDDQMMFSGVTDERGKALTRRRPGSDALARPSRGPHPPLFRATRKDCADFVRSQRRPGARTRSSGLCQDPPTPWWHIDFPLLNYRVPAWMAWRDGMKGLLYWGGMSYWKQTEDPWTQAPFYTGNGQPRQGQKGIVFQGEGSLVYPGHDVGYDGVVPRIRLKALRDAIEDYEYLAILQRLGKVAAAQKVVRSLTESFFQWNKDPVAYEKARAELAAMINAVSVEQGK